MTRHCFWLSLTEHEGMNKTRGILRHLNSEEIPGSIPVNNTDSEMSGDPIYFVWDNW